MPIRVEGSRCRVQTKWFARIWQIALELRVLKRIINPKPETQRKGRGMAAMCILCYLLAVIQIYGFASLVFGV